VRPVNLRARIEALERRVGRAAPALAVVSLYEDDDKAAAERWLGEFEARSPDSVAIVIKLSLPRPLGKPPFWSSPLGQ
jgi:hypothetical protein